MKKITFLFAALLMSAFSYAQIEGKWKTIDDETGKPKSIVEIFKKSDGKYYGKIVLGLEIIRGLKSEGGEFTGGNITDPKNGKTYKCTVKTDGADKLNVRGYVGFSLIGRSQTWHKVK